MSMAVLVIVVLAGLVLIGVTVELFQTHREREQMSTDERERHRRLMRELRRHH